jgi:hypothetical protein
MRWFEFGLFLAPFALFAAWRLVSARLRPAAVAGVTVAVVALAAGTLWFGLTHRSDPHEIYVPAHFEYGRIVPGHEVAP